MKSIFLITWANIKRRKIQTLLVGACIALAALMFSTLIGIGLGMERPFDNLYTKLGASHIMMNFDINVHDPTEITQWFEKQSEVDQVSTPSIRKPYRKKLIHKGKELTPSMYFQEHLGNSKKHNSLNILKGEETDYPAPGEIWIPNHWSTEAEFAVGDTLFIPTGSGLFPLKISAIVVDAHYSNGLMDPAPAWVGPGGLSMLFPVKELSMITLGVRVNDAAETEKIWARFHREYAYKGQGTLYALYKTIFQIVYQIIGGLLVVFSILGLIITMTLTSSVVNSAIKTDYKMIGMLKAQGFTNNNVILVYLIQFFIITCIAVPIGLIGGFFMTKLVFKSLIVAIGAINFDISMWLPAIGTFFAFLIGILLITYRTARQAGQIQAVTAIRNGGPPQQSFAGSKFSLFTLGPSSKLPLFLGLRFLMSNKKRAFLMLVALLFVVFVQLLYTNSNNSLLNLDGNKPAWGFSNAHVFATENATFTDNQNDEDIFKDEMNDEERVKSVVKIGFYLATLPAQQDVAPETFVGFVYDDEIEKLGLGNIEGRHPVFEKEISIGYNSSLDLNKTIGDTLELFMEGQLIPFTITGTFQSVNNMSRGFRIRLEGITEINPLFELDRYLITLKRGEDPQTFADDLLQTYGSTYKVKAASDQLQKFKGILNGIKDVFAIVATLFLGVLFVTVFNDTVLSIRENQKNLGIFKAIGMTPRQLQWALIIKALIIAFVALLIGVPISLQVIPAAMNKLTSIIGFKEFPYIFDLQNTLLTIPLVLAITIGSVWVASQRVLKIRPRILVRE